MAKERHLAHDVFVRQGAGRILAALTTTSINLLERDAHTPARLSGKLAVGLSLLKEGRGAEDQT